MTKMRKTTKFI